MPYTRTPEKPEKCHLQLLFLSKSLPAIADASTTFSLIKLGDIFDYSGCHNSVPQFLIIVANRITKNAI